MLRVAGLTMIVVAGFVCACAPPNEDPTYACRPRDTAQFGGAVPPVAPHEDKAKDYTCE
jgi:hypothetical protein